jgi:3',5'-cyclic AMP phosphodiesterase CpdA
MDRREFLKVAAAAGAALPGIALFGGQFLPFAEAADIPPFSFAHITDLHLDTRGVSNWQHREKSIPLFIDALRQLPWLPKIDFIIFGGDQIHCGPNDRDSLFVFQQWMRQVGLPYYVLLGNTEVSPVAGLSRLGRADYLRAWKGNGVGPDKSSWAFDPVRGVRIIGFDVTVSGRPYGEAGTEGLRWLDGELRANRKKKLIIVVTHQLLLPTAPRDVAPEWSLWMVRDHAAVREVLERYPNVRLVISGHHHASKVESVSGITYAADPAVVTFPCAFRVYTVTKEGIHLKNIGLDGRAEVERARALLLSDPYARLYDPDMPRNVLAYSVGLTDKDRETTIRL